MWPRRICSSEIWGTKHKCESEWCKYRAGEMWGHARMPSENTHWIPMANSRQEHAATGRTDRQISWEKPFQPMKEKFKEGEGDKGSATNKWITTKCEFLKWSSWSRWTSSLAYDHKLNLKDDDDKISAALCVVCRSHGLVVCWLWRQRRVENGSSGNYKKKKRRSVVVVGKADRLVGRPAGLLAKIKLHTHVLIRSLFMELRII